MVHTTLDDEILLISRERYVGDDLMKLVTLHVPETYIDGLEKLVESNLYPNRSEAIRIAIRDLLKRELWG